MLQSTTDWHCTVTSSILMLSLKHNLAVPNGLHIAAFKCACPTNNFFSMPRLRRYMQLAEQLEASQLKRLCCEMTRKYY